MALCDRLHQPYRQALIPGYEAVATAAAEAGAYGLVISGAGPTLLALAPAPQADSVALALAGAWQLPDHSVQTLVLQLDSQGARIINSP
jgi:homoserine kinase